VASGDGRTRAERHHERGLWRLTRLASCRLGRRGGSGGLGIELVKEGVGGVLALALAPPHDLSPAVVGDEREVVVLALPADFVDPDLEQVVEPAGIELVVADALDDPPDRVPVDPQHPRDRRLVRPCRQPRG